MEESKIAFIADILNENSISCFKVICSKCAGSGNFKTPENSRRTCLECFGKGYFYLWLIFLVINDKNICLLI